MALCGTVLLLWFLEPRALGNGNWFCWNKDAGSRFLLASARVCNMMQIVCKPIGNVSICRGNPTAALLLGAPPGCSGQWERCGFTLTPL